MKAIALELIVVEILALAAIAVLALALVFALAVALLAFDPVTHCVSLASGLDLGRDWARRGLFLVSTTSARGRCASDPRVIGRALPSWNQEHGPRFVATRTASLILFPLATSHAAFLISRSINDVRKSMPALKFATHCSLGHTSSRTVVPSLAPDGPAYFACQSLHASATGPLWL